MLVDIKQVAWIVAIAVATFFRSILGTLPEHEEPATQPVMEKPMPEKAEKVWVTRIDKGLIGLKDIYGFDTHIHPPADSKDKFETFLGTIVQTAMQCYRDVEASTGTPPVVVRIFINNWVSGRAVCCPVFITFIEEDGKLIPNVAFNTSASVKTVARAMNAILN